MSATNGKAATLDPSDLAAALAVKRRQLDRRVRSSTRAGLAESWSELLSYVEESASTQRESAARQWLDGLESRAPAEARRMRKALDTVADEEPDDEPEEAGGPKPFSLGVIGSAAFALAQYTREYLIRRILVKGQPCVVGGPRKSLKTSLMVEMVICLAAALRFLDEFVVPRSIKVLLLSGESGDATIQETALRICKAKGIDLDELEGLAFWGFNLPRLDDPEHMTALAEFIKENGIEAVVIDPLYLCLLSAGTRMDPANIFDMGPLLARIAAVCLDAGATPVLVHHLRKNRENPYSPPELEDLSYAGVQEFARQWIMVGRRERYEPGTGDHKLWLSAGGSAGHSGAWALDIAEGVVDDDFGGRDWRVTVTGATAARDDAKSQAETAKAETKAQQARAKDEAASQQAQQDARKVQDALTSLTRPLTKSDIRSATGVRGDRLDRAIWTVMHEWKTVGPCQFPKQCNGRGGKRTVDGYRLSIPGQHPDIPGPYPDTPGIRIPGHVYPAEGGSPPRRGESPRCAGCTGIRW